ncbi:hypothetical protein DNK47_02350, partial [Mycoplasma wenyonii]
GLLPKHLGNSQQKSTLPTTPAGNTSKATTAKPADMAGASLLLNEVGYADDGEGVIFTLKEFKEK